MVEKALILQARKNNPDISCRQLSELLNRHHTTISTYLKSVAVPSRLQLEALEQDAIASWGKALEVAGEKGEHKAAKDLLVATGVIEQDAGSSGVTIMIGMDGKPAAAIPTFETIEVSPGTFAPADAETPPVSD